MIEFESVFVDTAPYIYLLERNDYFVDRTESFIKYCIFHQKKMYTSVITIEEFSVGPYKEQDKKLLTDFHAFLKDTSTNVISVDNEIANIAAQIRAKYQHFKAMDALQLASAKLSCCDLFLTNDKQLKQYGELNIMTVDEVEYNSHMSSF